MSLAGWYLNPSGTEIAMAAGFARRVGAAKVRIPHNLAVYQGVLWSAQRGEGEC